MLHSSAVVLLLGLAPQAVLAHSGGPDLYGYTFIDSDESDGPVYSWTDISATGTATGIDDDGEVTIPLPFTFWFYGEPHSQVTVGDGVLLFGDDVTINNRNDCLPADNSSGDDALVLMLWDDLNAEQSESGDVYWEVLGAAPDRQLVVQYEDIPHYDSGTFFTFQAVLVETSNEILLQYASITGPDAEYSEGGSATVGTQGDTVVALEYSCDSDAYLHDELAISFDVICDDEDGDGVGECDGDCDDSDPDRGPTVAESDDGLDNDCDGLVDEDWVAVGDLVISELMPDPLMVEDDLGEWFEVVNVSARDIELQGWTFAYSAGSVTVESSVVVSPGEHALMAASSLPERNGGLPWVDWMYTRDDLRLTNTGDSLAVTMGATVIDELAYDTIDWTVPEGASLYLDPGYLDAAVNDDHLPWCITPSEAEYDYLGEGTGDYGTPGEANPEGLCCHDDDGDGWDVCAGDCDDGDPERFPGNPELQDLLDNDCDGVADEDWVVEGSVLVTELLDEPLAVEAEFGEYFELYNAGDSDLNLLGWEVRDESGDGFAIDQDLLLPAGSYAVLAVSADADLNGGLPQVDYVYRYAAFPLRSYDDDGIELALGELVVSTMEFSNVAPWPSEPGRSSYLCPGLELASGSSEGDDWAATPATSDFDYGGSGSGDYGTPGAANPSVDLDEDGFGPCEGDCDDSDPAVSPSQQEICDNQLDDDCDGLVDGDDKDCAGPGDSGDSGDEDSQPAGDSGDSSGDSAGGEDDDCGGCASGGGAGALALLLAAGAVRRRRGQEV